MHKTRSDLSKDIRKGVIELLQARLADAVDLTYSCKQAHWTLRGPDFLQLHELFDRLSGEVAEHADEIAERIATLGGQARGTVHTAAKETSLKPYPLDLAPDQQHVLALADRLAAFGKAIRADIKAADKLGDPTTTDLFTRISGAADKALWLVEAHIPSKD